MAGHGDGLEQAAIVRDQQERAPVRRRARTRAARWPEGRDGWWAHRAPGGSRPSTAKAANSARVRSPGESEDDGRCTTSDPRPNLASWLRAWSGCSPVARTKESATEAASRRMRRSWASSPTTTAGPIWRVPESRGSRPSTASTSVVLPVPFGPDEGDTVGPGDIQRERPQGEVATSHDRFLQADDDIAGAVCLADGEAQIPAFPGFLDGIERVQCSLGSASPTSEILRPLNPEVALGLVVVPRLALLARDTRGRPLPLALGPLAQFGGGGTRTRRTSSAAWARPVARSDSKPAQPPPIEAPSVLCSSSSSTSVTVLFQEMSRSCETITMPPRRRMTISSSRDSPSKSRSFVGSSSSLMSKRERRTAANAARAS